jgi:hypothetical protein
VEYVFLPDEDVDESFELVQTCQGVLRFPKKYIRPDGADVMGLVSGRWLVPDHVKWVSVPGFPDFLHNPAKLSLGAVRPLTADERREYLRGKAGEAPEPIGMCLEVLRETLSVRVNGKVVGLSPREFELLVRTMEESPLSHKRAVQFLEAVQPKSPGGVTGFVDTRALADHRKGILAKVEHEAGRQARVLLGEAFRSRSQQLVYDEGVLPAQRE